MRLLVSFLFGCLWLATGHAAEITSWKISLNDILDYNAQPGELRLIEKAPEPTVFFNEGDKLRVFDKEQIKAFLPTVPALEWAVWNETTNRLITKSDWSGYSQIYLRYPQDQPMQVRTTLSCHAVKDASKPPAPDAKPLMRLSTLSRSGEKSELNWQQGDSALNFEFETTIGEGNNFVHTRMDGSAQLGKETRTYINTAVTTQSGKSQWVARDYDGKKGLDILIHSQVEFIDGTPAEHAVQIQRNGKAETVDTREGRHFKTEKISDTHWLLKAHIHRVIFQQLVDQEIQGANEVNPFDPVPRDEATRKKQYKLKEVMAPEALKGRLPGPALDARVMFLKMGISAGKDDFLAYDPRTQILYFYTNKREEIDKVAVLLNFGGCGQPRITFATWELGGTSCLVARSGEKATIARMSQDGPSLRVLKIEPTVGENDELAHLRFRAEENSKPNQAFLVNAANTFVLGNWKTVAEHHTRKGKQEARIKVDLIELDHE